MAEKINTEAAPATALVTRAGAFLIVCVGLLAGTLDIAENLIFNQARGITPQMVFQYIASGLLGMRAFRAGFLSVTLGVVLHYFIALAWTAVFYVASSKLTLLRRRPVLCGLMYGGFVYLFMNLVVLPLSNVPHAPKAMTLASRINGVLAVLLCIGLTISVLVTRNSGLREFCMQVEHKEVRAATRSETAQSRVGN